MPVEAIPPKAKRGRPTPYRDEYVELAQRLVYLNANCTNEDLAKVFQVSGDTFQQWLVAHPAFSEAIAQAKRPADAQVANALLRRALGQKVRKQVVVKVKTGAIEHIELIETWEELPGDVTAQSLWLRNRASAIWKAQPEDAGGFSTAPIGKVSVTIQQPPNPANTSSDSNTPSQSKPSAPEGKAA